MYTIHTLYMARRWRWWGFPPLDSQRWWFITCLLYIGTYIFIYIYIKRERKWRVTAAQTIDRLWSGNKYTHVPSGGSGGTKRIRLLLFKKHTLYGIIFDFNNLIIIIFYIIFICKQPTFSRFRTNMLWIHNFFKYIFLQNIFTFSWYIFSYLYLSTCG